MNAFLPIRVAALEDRLPTEIANLRDYLASDEFLRRSRFEGVTGRHDAVAATCYLLGRLAVDPRDAVEVHELLGRGVVYPHYLGVVNPVPAFEVDVESRHRRIACFEKDLSPACWTDLLADVAVYALCPKAGADDVDEDGASDEHSRRTFRNVAKESHPFGGLTMALLGNGLLRRRTGYRMHFANEYVTENGSPDDDPQSHPRGRRDRRGGVFPQRLRDRVE